ncbi:DnaJ domain-containing protein [Dissulfurirhabdus thermomarina]|uniref:DnaJ domain-containing protein n=1 Tax=Dissulfurirhabdus thermomarina TaxID=1765737 RepID=A0A6N9TKI8_DISTH|nr:J domain-containing protein [Dissulfurirhabdus thermomarina]NDY41588.1 DnaJ domain-containing protein [Dissulfurirhabdus thermomarina]NMX22357.1 DnaJ domain-containing protein [Dissulfurirhabdus thermomarina]
MAHNSWDDIARARRLLGLPEEVSLEEIKDAYRRRCRRLHPDLEAGDEGEMARLNWAYRLLVGYAERYRIQLTPNRSGMSDEELWMEQFGQDPIWNRWKDD